MIPSTELARTGKEGGLGAAFAWSQHLNNRTRLVSAGNLRLWAKARNRFAIVAAVGSSVAPFPGKRSLIVSEAPCLEDRAVVNLVEGCATWRGASRSAISHRNSGTLNKESDEEMRSHAIGDNYLDEEIKTVSAQANGDYRSPLDQSALCCSSKAIMRKLSSVLFCEALTR